MTNRGRQPSRTRLSVAVASGLLVLISAPAAAQGPAQGARNFRIVDWQVIAGQGGRIAAAPQTPAPAPIPVFARPSRGEERGLASWYGAELAGEPTASGERFDPSAMTAAHKTLPLGSVVRVTHADTGRSVVVRINDRGPFVEGRIIDLSQAAARSLGMQTRGVAPVSVVFLGADPSGDAGAFLTAEAVPAAPPSTAHRVAEEVRETARQALADVPTPRSPDQFSAQLPTQFPAMPSLPAIPSLPAMPALPSFGRTDGRSVYVQAASFRDAGRAIAAAARLEHAGRTAIQAAVVNGRTVHRVVVGPWASAEAARDARASVEAAGFPGALIVTRR